jgi:hypothetical protein
MLMPERQRNTTNQPSWAARGAVPTGRPVGSQRGKRGPTPNSAVRSLATEGDYGRDSHMLLEEMSETVMNYIERLTKIEATHVAQIVAEMDVNPFGFSVLARWRDLTVAHATKTYWQQVYDVAHEVRDPIAALHMVIESASDGIIQNRVGPPEDVFHNAVSTATDIGRRDFLLEAKVLRDQYRSRAS